MDLFDAYGSRIAPRVDYEQQEEHSDPAQNQATNNPDRPPKRALSNDCPVGTQNDQNKPYKEKQYRLQQWELAVQVLLCFFTALAFGAAAIYAYIAKRQLDTMNATLKRLTSKMLLNNGHCSGLTGTLSLFAAATSA